MKFKKLCFYLKNKTNKKQPTGRRGLCYSVDKLQTKTDGLDFRAQISRGMFPYDLHRSL